MKNLKNKNRKRIALIIFIMLIQSSILVNIIDGNQTTKPVTNDSISLNKSNFDPLELNKWKHAISKADQNDNKAISHEKDTNDYILGNNKNIVTELVSTFISTVAILNATESPGYFTGGWANNYQSIYDGLIAAGKDTIVITNDDILSGALSGVGILILIDNAPNDAASIVVKNWALNGGGVISFDSSICFLNWAGLLPPEAEGTNGYETYWDYNSPSVGKVVNDAHPVMSGYSYGADIFGAPGDAQYFSDVIISSSAGPYYEPLVKTDIATNLDLVVALDAPYSGRVVQFWDFAHWNTVTNQQMILNAIEWVASMTTISFFDDFESGLGKWESITGLWHLTDTGSAWPDPCLSPTHSMWFGSEATGNFDTGFQEAGDLISYPFSLPVSPNITLEFYHWREGEYNPYDGSFVYISIDGTNWDLIYSAYGVISPWQKESIDITQYGGNTSVQLKFFFDTLDSGFNDYRGWLVDDIQVLTSVIDPSMRIGFIYTHEERDMPDLKMFYENLGYTVDEINSTITDSLLNNYSFIFVCESWTGTGWNAGEIAALENWMQYGGVLVGIGDEHLVDFEQLAAAHGISFLGYAEGSSGSTSMINSSHPLMTGVTSLYIPSVFNALNVSDTVDTIFWDSTGVGVYGAAVHVGLGRFLVIADDFWLVINDDDNEILFENILSWYYESPTLNITVTNPDSTSIWETGTSQSITWTSTGSISDVKIELYENGVFVMEIVASTPNDGEYSWLLPISLVDSTQYQIKISDVTNPATDDFSDNFEIFTTIIDSLTVTNPDSTSIWETDTSQSITWTSTGSISDVKIELYKDGVFVMEIVASTTDDGTYIWAIPIDLEDDLDYQIKISDVWNPATYDESSNFVITSIDIPDGIPSYNLYIVVGIMCVFSVILLKKRFKLIK